MSDYIKVSVIEEEGAVMAYAENLDRGRTGHTRWAFVNGQNLQHIYSSGFDLVSILGADKAAEITSQALARRRKYIIVEAPINHKMEAILANKKL